MTIYFDLIQHATSSVEFAYGVEVEALSFFYTCEAYLSYRPLLRFLALARRRLQNGQLFLDGSSSPSNRLPILDLPNELSHEIFNLVFNFLLEEEKLKVLHRVGLCSHAGACEKGPCCRHLEADADESSCRDDHGYSECEEMSYERAEKMNKIMIEEKYTITSLLLDFNLSILAYPCIAPVYSGQSKYGYPWCLPTHCLPVALGLSRPGETHRNEDDQGDEEEVSGPRSNLDLVALSRSDFTCGARQKFQDHAVLRVPDLVRLTREEEERFERVGRALRLKREGQDIKAEMLVVQSMKVKNTTLG
ncbi:hypothetical protein BDY24DRAFT_437703 [Mrakia frigida]|uniref:uncharacterized protein n=1 Tax=Mrakia frigida TaxID=29902 RepID=UPI003FCBF036